MSHGCVRESREKTSITLKRNAFFLLYNFKHWCTNLTRDHVYLQRLTIEVLYCQRYCTVIVIYIYIIYFFLFVCSGSCCGRTTKMWPLQLQHWIMNIGRLHLKLSALLSVRGGTRWLGLVVGGEGSHTINQRQGSGKTCIRTREGIIIFLSTVLSWGSSYTVAGVCSDITAT